MSVKRYLGLGKTMFNTAACEIVADDSFLNETQIILSERISRKKWDGQWPLGALEKLKASEKTYQRIHENRDITHPSFKEELLLKKMPFEEMLRAKGLSQLLSKSDDVQYVGHHVAHAYSALFHAPFKEMLILVMDGGGSTKRDLNRCSVLEMEFEDNLKQIEHTSLFYWNGAELELIEKEFLEYLSIDGQKEKYAQGIGSYYEKVAKLIFSDNMAAGKVMGLAGLGKSFYDKSLDLIGNQTKMDWDQCFNGKSKKEWQTSEKLKYWQDLAASVQDAFEANLFRWGKKIKEMNTRELPLVFTGGCALNCTANFKFHNEKFVSQFFIPPNPGDEGIALGLSYAGLLQDKNLQREVKAISEVSAFYGSKRKRNSGIELFTQYECIDISNDYSKVVDILECEAVIAWFQGRSECGPRALGHRSLLANCEREEIKSYLNETIKFREEFRPYGASILWEEVSNYFECESGFHNPFMSFAVPIRQEYRERLREVSHIDSTCRMQTVTREVNKEFYSLLKKWQERGHLPILLNTSLNIMGRPIVESVEDLLFFFENADINTIILDDWLIQKKKYD